MRRQTDTVIPLHVIDAISDSTLREIGVWSPDTDVLILLMDLVAHGRVGALTKIKFLTGKGNTFRSINIRECVSTIGQEKCKGLIGVHNLSGADWGGKFVGISKKSWITSCYPCPVMTALFLRSNSWVLTNRELVDSELYVEVRPIERFVCSVYNSGGPTTIPALRRELFRSKNLEGEKPPTTRKNIDAPHLTHQRCGCQTQKLYNTSPIPTAPTGEWVDACR